MRMPVTLVAMGVNGPLTSMRALGLGSHVSRCAGPPQSQIAGELPRPDHSEHRQGNRDRSSLAVTDRDGPAAGRETQEGGSDAQCEGRDGRHLPVPVGRGVHDERDVDGSQGRHRRVSPGAERRYQRRSDDDDDEHDPDQPELCAVLEHEAVGIGDVCVNGAVLEPVAAERAGAGAGTGSGARAGPGRAGGGASARASRACAGRAGAGRGPGGLGVAAWAMRGEVQRRQIGLGDEQRLGDHVRGDVLSVHHQPRRLPFVGGRRYLEDAISQAPSLAVARAAVAAGRPVEILAESAKIAQAEGGEWEPEAASRQGRGNADVPVGMDLIPGGLIGAIITEEGVGGSGPKSKGWGERAKARGLAGDPGLQPRVFDSTATLKRRSAASTVFARTDSPAHRPSRSRSSGK